MLHVSFLNLLRALILSIIFFKKKFLAIILLEPELALLEATLLKNHINLDSVDVGCID